MIIYFLPISLYFASVFMFVFQDRYIHEDIWGYYAFFTGLSMVIVGVNVWGVYELFSI